MISVLLAYVTWEVYWFLQVSVAAFKWHTFTVVAVLFFGILLKALKKHPSTFWAIIPGLSYVAISVAIGSEQHPFSMMPMYSSIPNIAYSFKLSDGQGNLVPIRPAFKTSSGRLSHAYPSYCGAAGIVCGTGQETALELKAVGRLLAQTMPSPQIALEADTVCLSVVIDRLSSQGISTVEEIMHCWQASKPLTR
jgi:hypothetical protein